jgi:hypothetical protein
MRNFRIALVLGALALAPDAWGCQDATNRTCPTTIGVFNASYQEIDGSCEATFEGNQISIAQEDIGTGTSSKTENRLSNLVRTDVVLKGCTVGVTQAVVTTMGHTQSEIKGDLNVESESSLSGHLLRTVYMDNGDVACHGVYNARFVRQDVTIGGATARSQLTP